MKKILSSALVAGMLLGIGVTTSMAMGGPSGPKTDYPNPGKIGEVIVNPYKIAPLTAIIRNGGYELKDIKV
ncbi:aryl-sulfate sulfotransferase N-terminal domain-containing protein, partial [Campylobacter ureolyticus]